MEFFPGGPGSACGGECGVKEGRLEKLWDLCLRAVQSNCNVQPAGRKGDDIWRAFSPCVLQACGRLLQLLHCAVGGQADNRLQSTSRHCLAHALHRTCTSAHPWGVASDVPLEKGGCGMGPTLALFCKIALKTKACVWSMVRYVMGTH